MLSRDVRHGIAFLQSAVPAVGSLGSADRQTVVNTFTRILIPHGKDSLPARMHTQSQQGCRLAKTESRLCLHLKLQVISEVFMTHLIRGQGSDKE